MDIQSLLASDADGLTRGRLHGPRGHRPHEFPVRTTNRDPGVQAWRDDAGTPVTSCNLFSFTLLSKNASANHLESHSCKNKGLKVPCFHTLTKNIGGRGCLGVSLSDFVLLISYLRFSLTPLDSALTSKQPPKPFRCNTSENHTQGEGGPLPHQPPLPPLPPGSNSSQACQTHRR